MSKIIFQKVEVNFILFKFQEKITRFIPLFPTSNFIFKDGKISVGPNLNMGGRRGELHVLSNVEWKLVQVICA